MSDLMPQEPSLKVIELSNGVIRVSNVAVHYVKGKVGAAFFTGVTDRLYLVDAFVETKPYFERTVHFLRQVNGERLVLSSACDRDLVEAVAEHCSYATVKVSSNLFNADRQPGQLFQVDNCSSEEVGAMSQMEAHLALCGTINFGQLHVATKCAMFALLEYVELPTISSNRLHLLNPWEFMYVAADTQYQLQVFPSKAATGDGQASLCSLIEEHTVTHGGKALLRSWLQWPLKEITQIMGRQDCVVYFVQSNQLGTIRKCLQAASALHGAISTTLNFPTLKTLQSMERGISACQSLCKLLSQCQIPAALSDTLSSSFDLDELSTIQEYLLSEVDFEAAQCTKEPQLRCEVSSALGKAKQLYAALPQILQEETEALILEEAANIDNKTLSMTVISYIPQFGFLTLVPVSSPRKILINLGWEYQFASDSHSFFKNKRMHQLDSTLGDVCNIVSDLEIDRLQLIQNYLKMRLQTLQNMANGFAKVDVLVAFAKLAKRENWTPPVLTEEPIIKLEDSWHPLLPLSLASRVVKNSLELDSVKTMIVTGANGSGKSVLLAQIGLVVYLAQIGCHVPASNAIIGIVDGVYARLGRFETRTSKLPVSAFVVDLQTASSALRNGSKNSLLLFDEFGKGTDHNDGVGLFCGLVRGVVDTLCARGVFTTHFHELNRYNLLKTKGKYKQCHMQIDIDDEKDETKHQLVPGATGYSLGHKCAIKAGLPAELVQRGKFAAQCFSSFEIHRLLEDNVENESQMHASAILGAKGRSQDLQHKVSVLKNFIALRPESVTLENVRRAMLAGTNKVT